jgi:carbon monoxide dehydrogenase subunit G
MRVVGSAVVGVDRNRVWTALRDPAVLVRTIPGCERLEATGADTYRMTVSAGVAAIKGVYQGEVSLSDPEEPSGFTLKARGSGAPGTVDATVRILLSEVDGGSTRVDYDAEAVVGGMIGGVGQRMLGSVAKKTAGEFFTAVDHHLCAPAETDPSALTPVLAAESSPPTFVPTPAATPLTGQVFERPAPAAELPKAATRVWPVLAAFGMGAGIALGSTAIGWVLGRASRRR